MLLNYLFSHFHEENDFVEAAGISMADLTELQGRRVMPLASYVVDSRSRSTSFVSTFEDNAVYRFHLKGYLAWLKAIDRLGLDSEKRARACFEQRFDAAGETFLSGGLGAELAALMPDVPARFDRDHAAATWEHFLKGVYGVCTCDGQPETVFLKQIGVMFVERMAETPPARLSGDRLTLLARTVDFLDDVESPFAPHEVAQASRQRCIIDIRARYLTGQAA